MRFPWRSSGENHGIVGDAHAGTWHRQVSLLGVESVAKVQQHVSFPLSHGAFAENILTEGICLYKLPVGTKLRIGQALAEVTQIGKECHSDCAIRKAAGGLRHAPGGHLCAGARRRRGKGGRSHRVGADTRNMINSALFADLKTVSNREQGFYCWECAIITETLEKFAESL